jgi:hypothetical protein
MPTEIVASRTAYHLEGEAEIPRMSASQARAVRRIRGCIQKTEMAPRPTEGTSQQTPSRTEDRRENGWRRGATKRATTS